MKLNQNANLILIRTKAMAQLAALGTELGVAFKIGNCSYSADGNNCTFKLEVSHIQADGKVMSKEASDFIRYAEMERMQPSHLGRKFHYNGAEWELIGYKPQSYKMPFVVKNLSTQTNHKFAGDSIRRMFNIA